MATYPVKMLKDKDGTLFVPLVNSDAIIMNGSDTLQDLLDEKQDTLVSGTNIKTINNTSLLGSGDITISGGGDNETQLYNFICNSVIPGDDNTNDTFIINVDADIRPNTFVYDSTAIYTNVKLGFNSTLFEQCYWTDRINIRLVRNNTTLKEFSVYGKLADINVDYIDAYGTWDNGNNIIFDAIFDCNNSEVSIRGQGLLHYDDIKVPMKEVYNIAIRKQDELSTQTAYSAKGSATKVPQITTNNLGQVTNITEVTITQQDISGKEDTSNKVTSISSSSTNTQYPSALAVYNYINSLNGNGVSY